MPPRSRASVPALSFPVERRTLDNGLRVVVSPDRSSPVVAVAVYYDVGIRSEPEGRTGFAHLFEHLMFQGSASLGKTEHFTYVQGSGGTLNGSTHLDYTNYYEVLPSSATELAMFLEADRMRSVALTQENLENQVAVVQNEIRVNVLNRPYGGFPWILLPPVLYDTFANAHNGYGDFVDLEDATLQDAQAFFDRYYAPGNAVLTVAGDVDPDEVLRYAEQHFGDIPAREVPRAAELRRAGAERRAAGRPHRRARPRARRRDGLAGAGPGRPRRVPAVRRARRGAHRRRRLAPAGPDAHARPHGHEHRRLPGRHGRPARRPRPHAAAARGAPPGGGAGRHGAEDRRRGARAARRPAGSTATSWPARVARMNARYLREVDSVLGRAQSMSVFEQQRGRAELVNEVPALLSGVTAEAVQAAAATLGADRAVLEIQPGSPA